MQSSNGVASTGDGVLYGNPGDCSALQLGKAPFCFSRPGVINVGVRSQARQHPVSQLCTIPRRKKERLCFNFRD